MVTLHAYILRELLKTLGLTVLALTALFTMGGGLYNVIRFEGLTTTDVLGFLPMLIPVVVTLTLPVAALFAATMVYGRLAAENELLACRAAGINVHRVFLSAILLAVFVAAFTLVIGNFVVPNLVQRMVDSARNDIRDLVASHLQNEGFFHYREKRGRGSQYTLTAERVRTPTDEALRKAGFETDPRLHYLLVDNPTFLQIDGNGKLVRFTVARHGLCAFDTRSDPIGITLDVAGARDFQVYRHDTSFDRQKIGPYPFRTPRVESLSMADIRDLLRWRDMPWEAPRLRDKVEQAMRKVTGHQFFENCFARLSSGQELVLYDGQDREFRLTGSAVRREASSVRIEDGRLAVFSRTQGAPTRYEAAEMTLQAAPRTTPFEARLTLEPTADQDVLVYEPRAGHYGEPRRKSALHFDELLLPTEVLREMQGYTPAALLDSDAALPLSAPLDAEREELRGKTQRMRRRVAATLHWRLGYTSSALVTVLMGAALGVVFRGSRALGAFAVAMIPFFVVMVLMVLGQKLCEDAATTRIGPLVTWGGLALVGVVDAILLRVGVPR
jgi:lipopolysaccharide export LptBFGC system permease protein LptF